MKYYWICNVCNKSGKKLFGSHYNAEGMAIKHFCKYHWDNKTFLDIWHWYGDIIINNEVRMKIHRTKKDKV